MRVAHTKDWKTLPLPEKHAVVTLDRLYSREQSVLIAAGFIPVEMEDKWFLFFEKDTLFCHRSWTGHCIYHIDFEREGESLRAMRAKVNRDPQQYLNRDDEREKELTYSLIENFLLKR